METLNEIIEQAYQDYVKQSKVFDYLGMPECSYITKDDVKNSFKNGYLNALQRVADKQKETIGKLENKKQ